mgnify:CR=1 FL=1
MFRFFTTRKWFFWSWLGSVAILSSLWVQVQIDVEINEWFGEFYENFVVSDCLETIDTFGNKVINEYAN